MVKIMIRKDTPTHASKLILASEFVIMTKHLGNKASRSVCVLCENKNACVICRELRKDVCLNT